MLVIADSCRSASMYEWIDSPNVLSLSSSLTHEESYSYDVDTDIGVYVIDRLVIRNDISELEKLEKWIREEKRRIMKIVEIWITWKNRQIKI